MKFIKCNPSNYAAGRRSDIKYIVVHYTANNGDTAEGNCKYFANANVKASAHYFVDENEVCQSVEEKDTAYHCGAKTYRHADCRNSNSIGVELCCRKSEQGKYYFMQNTINNAAKLINEIAKKYNISNKNILRHYDVTGKICPAPFVKDEKAWQAFKLKLSEANEMTVEQAKEIISTKIGLADKTIEYLWNYRYGDDLIIKIAKAVNE